MTVQAALDYAMSRRSHFVDQLGELVAIPSISTDITRRDELRQAADWLVAKLNSMGLKNAQLFPPDSHPFVYAEELSAGAKSPTVLIYGHYDVQPAEPLDKWSSDPFRPTVRGDNLYGRGASDMKGNVLATVFAVEALHSHGGLPVNVKFLIEGQEEIGSPTIGRFIAEHRDLLASDFCLNTDTGMLAPDMPTITYALRGLAYFELRVFGPAKDLHSGVFGGAVHNPAQALCELIAGMHDQNGTVTLPGFYDRVRQLDSAERAELARLPVTDALVMERSGVPKLWGESQYPVVERLGARPTLEINGIYSGFIGEGTKTVLPAYAMAKISTRLVPDQDADQIKSQLEAYCRLKAPPTVRWEVIDLVHSPPALSDRNSRWVKAMSRAQETVWGVPPLFKREGGSVPVVADLKTHLGIECVNVGCGLPDDNLHGPNEKLHLPAFYKLIDALIHFLGGLG